MFQPISAIGFGALISLTFLNPACTCGSSRFTYSWILPWRILSVTFHFLSPAYEMSAVVQYVNILWQCRSLGLEWKLTFPSPVTTAEFSKFADLLTAALQQHRLSGFSMGQLDPITSTSLVVMLPRSHLTSCSRMSVTTPLWLYRSWRLFLYSFPVYPCHVFLISSVSVLFLLFLCFIVPLLPWNSPLISLVLLRSFHCFVFLYFSPLFTQIDLFLLAILLNSAFHCSNLSFFPLLVASVHSHL